MIRLFALLPMFFGCSVRHLEGHDHYSEVCVDGTLELHLELGNTEIDCSSGPSTSGQLRMSLAPDSLLQLPVELGVDDFIRAEWCDPEMECIPITAGTLSLTGHEEGIALSGPYSFELADGSRIEGDLAAQFCDYSPCP